MSTSFPTTLDQYATVPENQGVAVQHRNRHQNIEDAMEAVQAKIGVNNSAVATSLDFRVNELEQNALVGPVWPQNSVPVGNASGTIDRLVMGISTVLGRSSTGDVDDKPCTDFGFTLLTSATAADARTNLSAQAANANLTGLSALAVAGIASRTAAGGWNARTLTGTAGRLTVTNGTGEAGNPTFDIDPAYVAGVTQGGTGISSYTPGNYVNALNATTLQQRTPAQVRADLAVDTSSSGTYTPTFTNVSNVSANAPQVARWLRVGNVVTVSGMINITPTAAAATIFRLSLPVASAITANSQVVGAGYSLEASPTALAVYSDAATDTAEMQFNATTTALRAVGFHFTYVVL